MPVGLPKEVHDDIVVLRTVALERKQHPFACVSKYIEAFEDSVRYELFGTTSVPTAAIQCTAGDTFRLQEHFVCPPSQMKEGE